MPLHRHHLGRLMFERVEPMHVACENLQGRDNRGHPHRHREHFARVRIGLVLQQVPGTDSADHESGRQIGGHYGVDEAVGEARVKDDVPPAGARQELTIRANLVPRRSLHPAIDAEDPKGRHKGAERDHQRRGEVQLLADFLHPEQHHAKEARFEEEGGQHLIGHQRPDHRPGLVREHRPVGAELVGHDDAGDDAHRESNREDLQPILEQVMIDRFAGLKPQPLKHGEVARQPDREGREEEVEADGERELDPRKQQSVEVLKHDQQLIPWRRRSIAFGATKIRFEGKRVAAPGELGAKGLATVRRCTGYAVPRLR